MKNKEALILQKIKLLQGEREQSKREIEELGKKEQTYKEKLAKLEKARNTQNSIVGEF